MCILLVTSHVAAAPHAAPRPTTSTTPPPPLPHPHRLQMLIKDVTRFALLVLVILLGFSVGMEVGAGGGRAVWGGAWRWGVRGSRAPSAGGAFSCGCIRDGG